MEHTAELYNCILLGNTCIHTLCMGSFLTWNPPPPLSPHVFGNSSLASDPPSFKISNDSPWCNAWIFSATTPFLLVPDLFLVLLCKAILGYTTLASPADVLRGASRIPAPQTSAELKDKFLSHCSQITAGDLMQIIRDPVGAVEIKVLTGQTHTYKLCRVWYVTKDFCSWREYRRY